MHNFCNLIGFKIQALMICTHIIGMIKSNQIKSNQIKSNQIKN
ncbi:Tyrosyl-tRNA synthetase [Acinetobacter gerneri DSM 14967 = CIP 107464 = MTCC 9824]|nr:Tyrosyl-tRNA synthetase [Acinetobacter gerneri DSM 14967 = CIP 107464 = MTCC 9824]